MNAASSLQTSVSLCAFCPKPHRGGGHTQLLPRLPPPGAAPPALGSVVKVSGRHGTELCFLPGVRLGSAVTGVSAYTPQRWEGAAALPERGGRGSTRKKTTSQAHPDSWPFPAPSRPLAGQAGAWQGAESCSPALPCFVLQRADSTPQTSAGWKVRTFLSPAQCLGLSVPACEGGVLWGDTLGGVPGGSGAARRDVPGSSQHPPQASPGMCQLRD